ncbi:MAG: hypothetical protein M1834_001249 [Cirrosporium novae-zelandiae]|nr:MAG: hypothetical protein M1834_001249 [Cirrosporium novae-zelandiae]
MASQDSSPPPSTSKATSDVIVRNALRYSLSAQEYETLHKYLLTRSPPVVKRKVPSPSRYEAIVKSKDDYNIATVRAALRVFIAVSAGLKLIDVVKSQLFKKGAVEKAKPKIPFLKSPNFRLPLSLSLILLLHRILRRFFVRLRVNLLHQNALPFRRRNPRVSKALTSSLAPAVGASLAGFALGVYPEEQLRLTAAIFFVTNGLQFAYNALENEGWFKDRPWWFGSWMLQPLTFGQLLHAFIFDRDCFPEEFGTFILKNTPNYIQRRPADYPSHLSWPTTLEIADGLGEMAKLNWPAFTSPILFPDQPETLPPSLTNLDPITSSAHPIHTSLSCALIHPGTPSCLLPYLQHFLLSIPQLAKYLALIFTAFSIPKYQKLLSSPISFITDILHNVLRSSLFISGSIGTAWASICLFINTFPRNFFPTQRFCLAGFLAGFWAILAKKNGRPAFLYSTRASLDSLMKVGSKRGWWKRRMGVDLGFFVLGLTLVNVVYEVDPEAVTDGMLRKGMGILRGDGWGDKAVDGADGKKEKDKTEGKKEE